jgi:glycosyltransferase involved in cell wall biosynthesis
MAVRALPMARALVRRGHSVTVLLPPWQNPEDSDKGWDDEGVSVENIRLPAGVPLLFHAATALRLTRRAQAWRPDVVHLFKPKSYSGLAHWMLARLPRGGRPRLVIDTDDWEGAGGWNSFIDPASGRPLYTPLQRRFFAWQERWGLAHADAVTAASRTLEGLCWALGVPPGRVFYIPNGTSSSRLLVDGPVLSPAGRVIMLYTRFFEFPLARVIELLRRVRERVEDARLLVVGRGFFGEEETLLREAQRAGFGQAVEYAGWVDPEELPQAFARAQVAIYPFDDTLLNRTKCPVKLLDLLTVGVPVVAEGVGEIREAIRHAETGWLVEPGDVDGFAAAVVKFLQDGALRERIGRGAAEYMRRERSWDRLAERVEQAYAANLT